MKPRLEKKIVDNSLVAKGARGDLGRKREDDVEVAEGEQVRLALGQPGARRRSACCPGNN